MPVPHAHEPGGRGRLTFEAAIRLRHGKPPENFYVITARMDAKFAALRKTLGDERFEDEEGTGFDAYERWKDYWRVKVCPTGDLLAAQRAMFRPVSGLRGATPAPQTSGTCSGWRELGPTDMPVGTSFQRGVGRADWITFDPNDPLTMFTGSSAGGLWVSNDAGGSWHNGNSDFFVPNLGAAYLAVNPLDSNNWFLATGDGDGLDDNGWSISYGVLRTPDKGVTWERIGLDASAWWSYQIKKLVIDPTDSNHIIAATTFGLFYTNNALSPYAAGVNTVVWHQYPTTPTDRYYDVVYQPGVPQSIYASGTTVVHSSDNGQTWSAMTVPFAGPNVVRIALEATQDYLYAVVVSTQPAACNGTSYTDSSGVVHPIPSSSLYRFDFTSQSWTDKGPICNTGSYATDYRGVHPGRAHSIGVSPSDENLIYIADVNPVTKCTTGGDLYPCNWIQTANDVHADVHQIKFSPDGQTIYAASDGGMFKTIDFGASWTPQNNGLSIATVDAMSTSATDPSLILAGLFDTGTILGTIGNTVTWQHVLGGDGREPIIDYSDPTYMYASFQCNGILRSDNMGATFPNYVGLPPTPCDDFTPPCPNWSTFYVLNSSDPQTVFGACHPEVMRSTSRGGGWVNISDFTGMGLSNYETWKVFAAPSDPNYLYAELVTMTSQLLMLTTKANDATLSNISWLTIPHPSLQWISQIDVDDSNPNNFYLVYGGYAPANEKVYFYDGTWHNLTTNLQNMTMVSPLGPTVANLSVGTIVKERGSDRIFVGTNLGVYVGRGMNPVWTRLGGTTAGELPYVEISKLEINYVNNTLRAATHGRGIWEISLEPCPPPVPGPDAVIRDSDLDIGSEPDTETGPILYESPEIWVRNAPDHRFTTAPVPPRYSHEEQHQNPEYSPLPFNTPFIYVKVHNRGSQPVSGTVHIYYGNAATGLNWSSNWTEILPANSATTAVASLQPGGDWVVNVQWTTIPVPPGPLDGHYCLLARFEADATTPDPINNEVFNNGIYGNVGSSNNIAWKNVTIVDDYQNKQGNGSFGGGNVIIRNVARGIAQTQLHFDFAPGGEDFFEYGTLEVDLGGELFAHWREGGLKGSGLRAGAGTTVTILQPHAILDGLRLAPREEHRVTVRVRRGPKMPAQRDFTLRLTQYDGGEEGNSRLHVVGGESFFIRPPRGRTPPPRPRGYDK